jgi:putative membrane protein
MPGFLIRWAIVALGLWVADEVVDGIAIADTGTLILAAAMLGLVNAFVRPLFVLITFPLTIVTLGLFLLVVNAAMLGLVALLLDPFTVSGFGAALLGSIVVSLTSWFASWFVGPKGKVEVLVVRR